MNPRMRVVLLTLAALTAAGVSRADPSSSHLYIAPQYGYVRFDEDLTTNGNKFKNGSFYGGQLGYQFSPHWAFEVAGGFASAEVDTAGAEKVKFTNASGNIMWLPWGRGLFLSEGFGYGRMSRKDAPKDNSIEMGLLNSTVGFIIPFSNSVGLRIEGRHLFWIPKTDFKSANIGNWILGGGLSFNFGGGPALDTDQDGVTDRKDKCPNTPLGARVDENGCPLDADGDAVPDGIDQCPNTPKGCRVDARGCPIDSDGDGVCDGQDRCEGTPRGATVDARGCPTDSDNDGVPDGVDQCPDTPSGTPVDERGCPRITDSDGDGVPDDKDECPNTPAGLKVDVTGCPIEVRETETQLMDTGMIRLEDVHFETAKADISPADMPRLDTVGQVLVRWPELRIEIGGHADARGSDAYNLQLSQKRVDSVLDYLLTKFPQLKREQYVSKGYGERKPIAPNNNATNMARNRRVEFKVLNRDVLRKEVERRRLLRKNEGTPADTTR